MPGHLSINPNELPIPLTLLAVDPGSTTGWIRALVTSVPEPEDEEPHGTYTILEHGIWHGTPHLYAQREKLFGGVQVVVTEDYRVYPHKAMAHVGSQVPGAKEIGKVELLACMYGARMSYQMASQAKQLWPNQRCKHHFADFWATLKSEHEKDALRHLATFLEDQRLHIFFRLEDAI